MFSYTQITIKNFNTKLHIYSEQQDVDLLKYTQNSPWGIRSRKIIYRRIPLALQRAECWPSCVDSSFESINDFSHLSHAQRSIWTHPTVTHCLFKNSRFTMQFVAFFGTILSKKLLQTQVHNTMHTLASRHICWIKYKMHVENPSNLIG